ncbi:MAG: 4a-hydroxytetrahydrobiopterin dehydratase [Pseudolabrys sp.]
MTETLAEKKCTPCRGGIPPLTHEEAERFLSQTPGWELREDGHRIERTFRFRNFQEALAFVRNVGDLAEAESHHPDVSFGWGYATISLRTKKSRDCTRTILSWRARSTGCSRPPMLNAGPSSDVRFTPKSGH